MPLIHQNEQVRKNSEPVPAYDTETSDRKQPALRLDAEVVEDRIAPAATDKGMLWVLF